MINARGYFVSRSRVGFLHPVFFVLLFAFCSPALTESLLSDTQFQSGFIIQAPGKKDEENLEQAFTKEKPKWILSQWGSRVDIAKGTYEQHPDHHYFAVTDTAGRIIKAIAAGYTAGEKDLYIETSGLAEFTGRQPDRLYRKKGEWWPNFLVSQKINSDTFHRFEKIVFSVDARLEFDNKNQQDGYQRGLHAGRFVVAITVKDMFGANYLWLMLPLYDDRFEFSTFGCKKCIAGRCTTLESFETDIQWRCPIDSEHVDLPDGKTGTRKMMFRVASKEMTDKTVSPGEWVHFEIDILPYIREALRAARQAPDIDRISQYFNYYYIGSFNIGWEINGLNHAGMSIKNLQLKAEKKPRLWDKIKNWF